MNTYVSAKRSILLIASLVAVVIVLVLLKVVSGNDQELATRNIDPFSETVLPGNAVSNVIPPAQMEAPAPLNNAHSKLPEMDSSGLEEISGLNRGILEDQKSTSLLQEPTEQQLEYQVLLEQKVNGDIQVYGPMLPEILNSKEFAALTKQQRNVIAQRIVDRLNSGELNPEDVYP